MNGNEEDHEAVVDAHASKATLFWALALTFIGACCQFGVGTTFLTIGIVLLFKSFLDWIDKHDFFP